MKDMSSFDKISLVLQMIHVSKTMFFLTFFSFVAFVACSGWWIHAVFQLLSV